MKDNLIATVEVIIQAPVSKVWNGLTDPTIIKQYFFGTEVVTDWKKGSPIIWKGVWKDKPYEDKGEILQIVPNEILEASYWSSMSGLPDTPENYNSVKYVLEDLGGKTKLTISQDNNPTEEVKTHSENNWKMVLEGLKKIMEE